MKSRQEVRQRCRLGVVQHLDAGSCVSRKVQNRVAARLSQNIYSPLLKVAADTDRPVDVVVSGCLFVYFYFPVPV